MRVALLQLSLDRRSPAANLQVLMHAIQQAADVIPAPDLLVLPGACATGGSITGPPPGEAHLTAVRETLAWKAREWGLYIAVGLSRRDHGVPTASVVLFDPDGDVVAVHGPGCWQEHTKSWEPSMVWPTTVGLIGVVEVSAASWADGLAECADHSVFLAVPYETETKPSQGLLWKTPVTKRQESSPEEALPLPERMDIYWGVVSPTTTSSACPAATRTFVCGPGGRVLAAAETTCETVVVAEVPLG